MITASSSTATSATTTAPAPPAPVVAPEKQSLALTRPRRVGTGGRVNTASSTLITTGGSNNNSINSNGSNNSDSSSSSDTTVIAGGNDPLRFEGCALDNLRIPEILHALGIHKLVCTTYILVYPYNVQSDSTRLYIFDTTLCQHHVTRSNVIQCTCTDYCMLYITT
jgi:hypothetical protein